MAESPSAGCERDQRCVGATLAQAWKCGRLLLPSVCFLEEGLLGRQLEAGGLADPESRGTRVKRRVGRGQLWTVTALGGFLWLASSSVVCSDL